tara:strand:+ start:3841 stop:4029 length:189 start_codon:yes stop_codon:yes gene_type:complete
MNINLTKSGATFSTKRKDYYPNLVKQLDLLYHDIDAGKLGETAKTSTFYLARKAVKDKYPSG